MPVGRIFNDLTIFDVLGNFIPGVVVFVAFVSVLPKDSAVAIMTAPLGAVIVLSFVAFALGHLVQRYASEAVGRRETFKNTLITARSLGYEDPINPDNYHKGRKVIYYPYRLWVDNVVDRVYPYVGTSTFAKMAWFPIRLYRSVLEASLLVRLKKDEPLSDERLATKVWMICKQRFDLDAEYDNYGDLLHLISSDLERHGPSRALRFQAIRNFQRGMWIACYFAAVVYALVAFGDRFPDYAIILFGVFGLDPWPPAILSVWTPTWTFVVFLTFTSYLFWEMKEKYEEEFVEYLFTDFLTSHSEEYL